MLSINISSRPLTTPPQRLEVYGEGSGQTWRKIVVRHRSHINMVLDIEEKDHTQANCCLLGGRIPRTARVRSSETE